LGSSFLPKKKRVKKLKKREALTARPASSNPGMQRFFSLVKPLAGWTPRDALLDNPRMDVPQPTELLDSLGESKG